MVIRHTLAAADALLTLRALKLPFNVVSNTPLEIIVLLLIYRVSVVKIEFTDHL